MATIVRCIVGVVVSSVVLSTACADLDGLSAKGGTTSSDDGGSGLDGTAPDGRVTPDADAGDAALGNLAPKVIRCATTTTTCDGRQGADCCLTVTGTDSASARELGTLSAKCESVAGPNCGTYTAVGDDFTMKLPQGCARTIDCDTGQVCCAVSGDMSQRLSTRIGSISCFASDKCATAGRQLCDMAVAGDCPPTLNCLPETDPVLSKLYPSWCR